ncbi:MAG: FAD-binding oxidoreductase [Acidobacteriota bacterium]
MTTATPPPPPATAAAAPGLRTLPRRVFDGFGAVDRGVACYAEPRSAEEVVALFRRASEERVPVSMRGWGRSYGDAAMNNGNLLLDMRAMKRVLSWDPQAGIIECEPGLTINDLWQHTLPDGWWPPVTTGTSWPTLGAAAAMNVHGKNHYKMGGLGDWILEVDLATPSGELLTLSREEEADLFHAAVGGFGMLGCFTRIKLQLKKVHGGRLWVKEWTEPTLHDAIDSFRDAENHDYFVGWTDCIGKGSKGRSQMHWADYTKDGDDPEGKATLLVDAQKLPGSMLGVPAGLVPVVLGILYKHNAGVWLTNTVKYAAAKILSGKTFYQPHAAFHFLLDQMPGFRGAYQPGGFIQYQPFVPAENAVAVFREIFEVSKRRGVMSYLGVLKKYRPDEFLLSHGLDGFSMALDYPVTKSNKETLWTMCHEFNDLVIDAGGKFYPAKDQVLRPSDVQRMFGEETLGALEAHRRRVDPERILRTELSARFGLNGPVA